MVKCPLLTIPYSCDDDNVALGMCQSFCREVTEYCKCYKESIYTMEYEITDTFVTQEN